MTTNPVWEVVAAVLETDGKVWLIKYSDEPDWPWQLVNTRHDGKNAAEVMKHYLKETYEVNSERLETLGTITINDPKTHAPLMAITAVYIKLPPGKPLRAIDGISHKLVDVLELGEYEIARPYREFVGKAFSGAGSQ